MRITGANGMRKLTASLFLSFLAVFSPCQGLAAEGPAFPVVRLQVGMHLINAEVASTPEQRKQGLMYRKSMAPNDGMLFDFGAPAHVCMWMKNTYIPLSVAFIDQDGVIVNIEDMKPRTRKNHCALKPVRYALEMNQGWFRQISAGPGTRISVHGQGLK